MNTTLDQRGVDYSIRVAELVRYLRENGQGFPLCDRLLYCGVNAGLAIREGKKPAAAALVDETVYIIGMAVTAGYLTRQQSVHIRGDCDNLLAMLHENNKTEEK